MVIEIATIVGAWLLVLIVSTLIANRLIIPNIAIQISALTTLAVYLSSIGLGSLVTAAIIISSPIIIKVLTLVVIFVYSYRALNGDMGEESRWAAELIRDGDKEFTKAMTVLSTADLKEAKIVADSKEELRDMTVERYLEVDQ